MPLDFDIISGLSTVNSEALKLDTQDRINKLLAIPNPTSGEVIMPQAPNVSGTGDPMRGASIEARGKLALDTWFDKTKKQDSGFLKGAGTEAEIPYKGTERYLDEAYGYNPNRDNEDFYAQRQSAMGEIIKGVTLRFPALTVSKLGTGLGYLAGLMNPENWGDNYIANAADNAFARTFENLEDNIKNDWLPSFQENADKDKGLFARAFTDINFWSDDFVDTAAFMASAFVPGLGLAKIGVGAKASAAMARLGIAAENGVLGNIGLTKLANYMGGARAIATGIDKTLITALSTASEAMWEAKGVRDSTIEGLTGKINPETGREYTDLEKKELGGTAARNTFLANAALLSVSNLWETNLLFKALRKDGNAIKNLARNEVGKEFAIAKSASAAQRLVNSKAADIALAAAGGIVTEGFYEENMQLAVQRVYDGTAKYSNIFNQLFGQSRDAVMGDDTEAAISIGLGGLIGGVAGAAGNAREWASKNMRTQKLISDLNRSQAAWLSFGSVYKRDSQGNLKLDRKNNPELDTNKMSAVVQNWNRLNDLKISMDATTNPDIASIIQKEAFAEYVKAHINGGIEDTLDAKLDALTSMSDEALVNLGYDPSSNKNRLQDVADLKNYAQKLIQLNNTIERDILTTPNKDESDAEFALRKQYLYTIGSRQLALQNQAFKITREIENLKNQLMSADAYGPEDELTDRFNYLRRRIEAQRATLTSLENYELDGADTNTESERQELADLTKEFNDLKNGNKEFFASLIERNNIYQAPGSQRSKSILSQAYEKKMKQKAELDNAAKSTNNEFYKIADGTGGYKYFNNKIRQQLEKLQSEDDLEDPSVKPSNTDDPNVRGKTLTITMKPLTGTDPIEFELEEGKTYIGALSKSTVAYGKNVRATIFKNDKIRIINLNDDGTVLLTINDDAPVTFTVAELADVQVFKKYADLTPLQKFYLFNRNKVFKYRVPVKFNKETKKWETQVIEGRLSYDKKDNVLKLAYKKGDKIVYIDFDPKYVVGQIDLTGLPTDAQIAMKELERRFEDYKRAQYQLFEELITSTDVEIELQKERSTNNLKTLNETRLRLDTLTNDLNKYKAEFADTDKAKKEDKRTKAGRLNRIITKLESEIATVQAQLNSLTLEREDIIKRQQALEFMMDEYLTTYDSLLDSGEVLTRAELSDLEEEVGRLTQNDKGARYSIVQVETMLTDTLVEQEIVETQISNLEGYLKDLQEMLSRFKVEQELLFLFIAEPNIDKVRQRLQEAIDNSTTPEQAKLYKIGLNRVNRNPDYFYDVRFLANEIKSTVDIINRAKYGTGYLQARIDQLTANLQLKSEIENAQERINFLKTTFSALAAQFERSKIAKIYSQTTKDGTTTVRAKTVEDAQNLKEQELLLSDFLTEPPSPGDFESEEKTLFWSTDKPVMTKEQNALFKSADSHYPNDVLNPQVYTQRFFKFTSQIDLASGDYYIMPVTADNDGQFGTPIRFTEDTANFPDDIKFVVAKKVKGEYKPVDINGDVLTTPNSTNIVYSSLYGNKELLSGDKARMVKWMKDTFAVKNLTDDELYQKGLDFIKFRDQIKDYTKRFGNQFYPISSKSNGFQNREPKDTQTGLPQQLPVEGRLTDDTPNWTNVDMVISTLSGDIAGSTNVKLKPGRLAIRKNGNVFQVYNRLLTQKEKDRIQRLLNKLTFTLGRKIQYQQLKQAGAALTPEEELSYQRDIEASDTITSHLSSIIYWDRPKEGQERYKNQFQLVKGKLHRGPDSIPFTPSGIEEGLQTLLTGVYHQVSNRLLTGNLRDKPYRVIDVDSSGDLTSETWGTYKEYLLSSKGRDNSDIPVYTNVVQNIPSEPAVPQLKNSYLNFGSTSENLPEVATALPKTTEIPLTIEGVQSLKQGDYVLSYENPKTGTSYRAVVTYNTPTNFTVGAITTGGGLEEAKAKGSARQIFEFIAEGDQPIFPDPNDENKAVLGLDRVKMITDQGAKISVEKHTPIQQNFDKPKTEVEKKENPQVTEAKIVAPTEPESTTLAADTKVDLPPVTPLNDLLSQFDDNAQGGDDDDNYRLALVDEDFVKENQREVQKWFGKNLPQVSLSFVDYLIKGKAWGQFKDGAVQIYTEAEQGTGFHEAFEAVWNSMLSPDQQDILIADFAKRDNAASIIRKMASVYKGSSQDTIIKEALAEEFRQYVLNEEPKFKGRINSFFRQLWNFIKSLFGIPVENMDTIDDLFRRINTGGFANSPIINYNKAVANFRRLDGITQEVTSQAIEGLTAQFFMKLFQKKENTDSLFSKEANASLINTIWSELKGQLTNQWNISAKTGAYPRAAIELGFFNRLPTTDQEARTMLQDLTPEQLTSITNRVTEYRDQNIINYRDKALILQKFNTDVFDIFTDYLKQYGFSVNKKTSQVTEENVTDELDVEAREPEATDPLGIRDSITIDTRNTANATVRLLIASLTDDRYSNVANKPTNYNTNSLGLPVLVDYDKTLNTLFNELQGTMGVFKNGQFMDSIDIMFEKLDSKYMIDGRYKPGFVWIDKLKRRLKYIDGAGNKIPLTDSAQVTEEDIRLRVAFIKSFSKTKNQPIKMIVGDGNNIYTLDPVATSNDKKISENWANLAKANFQKSNDFLKLEKNKIVFNTGSEKFQSLLKSRSLTDKADLLAQLGIVFSIPTDILTKKYAVKFGDAANRIVEFIQKGEITTFDDMFSKQVVNGPINALLAIERENNADNLSLQYRNAEGQTEYSIVIPSNMSNVINSLKLVGNLSDFVLTNPQFGQIGPNSINLNTYQAGSELLNNILFNPDGTKKRDLNYYLISGIAQVSEADGEITAKLKRPDKVIQELYHILDGKYYTLINSDKSSEFALDFGHFVSLSDFTLNSRMYNGEVKRIYTNHLTDEVNSLIELAGGIGTDVQYYTGNQRAGDKWMLTHFRNVITDPSNIQKLQEAIKSKSALSFATDPSVQTEIENYLRDFIKRQQDSLVDIGVVQRLPDGSYKSDGLSKEQMTTLENQGLRINPASFTQGQFDTLASYIFINHQIAAREQHKLIYGHPALYKDLPKRSNGATSTKEAIVDSPEVLAWMDKNYPREDGKLRSADKVQTFNNISYADNIVVSLVYKEIAEGMYASMIKDMPKEAAEARIGAKFSDSGILSKVTGGGDLAAYTALNEADAHAMILPDFYRDLLFLSAKWSAGQNRQWDYEMAYERGQRSKKSADHPSYKPYTPEQVKEGLPEKDQATLALGNPGYVLPILKPQYFGYSTDPTMMHTVFLKHSVQPRFYRFFENSNFESIYVQAQNSKIDIIGYESGEKVGNIFDNKGKFVPAYNPNGSINSTLPPIQNLLTKFYGIQVEMAAKIKETVVRGTQMTKIIMANLYKDGKPIKPEYKKIIDEYNQTLREITKLGKVELLNELGLEIVPGGYVTRDLKKLVSTLRDEAVKRDLPSNIVEAFEASLSDSATGLVYKFDSFSNRDKIDNILNAIVDSRVISQKMHGKAAVQAAVSLSEPLGSNRKIVYLNNGVYEETTDPSTLTKEQQKTARLASSDLKFYTHDGGRTSAMEVYLPHYFKELYGQDVDVSTISDPRLLKAIGFRIPTQGMNSIENIIIKGFLHPEEGDTIIVPSEIVGKSGSDFDIDKMNVYLPNYRMVGGKPVYIEPDDPKYRKEGLQNRLIELSSNLLSLPENYRQLIVPNGADTLKALEASIFELKGRRKDKVIPFTELSEWNYMNETRERFLVGKQLVGIGAIHITNHALSQISDIVLTGIYDEEPINIKFSHNVNEDGNLYLSAVTTKDGQWISELLSEALTGFVDAAKDPFVFELNINPSTAGSYFYLLRLGVPISEVVYFHTQPIIMEYIKNQQVNESMINQVNGLELSKRDVTLITQSDYITKAFPGLVKGPEGKPSDLKTLLYNVSTERSEYDELYGWYKPSDEALRTSIRDVENAIAGVSSAIKTYQEKTLKEMIAAGAKGAINAAQARQQLSVLSDFLKYQNEGTALSNYVNGMSYDTAKTKNIIENKIQEFNYEKVLEQNFVANPNSILTSTFLDIMKEEKEEIPKMFQNYFVALHPNAEQPFQLIYDLINQDSLSMTDDKKKEFINRFQNFFLNYVLHTQVFVNPLTDNEEKLNNYYNLFFGTQSFAHQLQKAKNKYPNNALLRELFPIVSTDNKSTDNVKLFSTKLSTYESNVMIESALNLLEQAQTDPELKEFMTNLAIFSVVQSGVQQSPISYTKVLPNELYANLVGSIFDKFTDITPNFDVDTLYKQFFQNNYWNTTLVPSATDGYVNKDGIMVIRSGYRIAAYDFLVKKVENTNPETNKAYTKAEREALIKNKDWDTLYKRTLYQKFLVDGSRSYFRPVNILGNRIFGIEAYQTDTSNMTVDQIRFSDVNGYIDENTYSNPVNDLVEKSSKQNDQPSRDDSKNFLDDNTCKKE